MVRNSLTGTRMILVHLLDSDCQSNHWKSNEEDLAANRNRGSERVGFKQSEDQAVGDCGDAGYKAHLAVLGYSFHGCLF